MTTSGTDGYACAVCGLIVDTVSLGGKVTEYRHAIQDPDDHPVVPVPWRTIRTNIRCDFCLEDNARWVLPCEDYEIGLGQWNRGDWAACDADADALRANDWNKIKYRAGKAHEERTGEKTDPQIFNILYDMLRQHVTGKVHLLVEAKT